MPRANSKNVVREWLLLAGGPAANAAVACRALGGEATLLTVLGRHPLTHPIREDLEAHGVAIRDMTPERTEPPAFASVLVSSNSGERLAVSSGGLHLPQPDSDAGTVADLRPDVVLVDGHLISLCCAAAREARRVGIPIVLDAGSWKAGFEMLLPLVDAAICSEDFRPPGSDSSQRTLEMVRELGATFAAVTQGERPVLYSSPGGSGEIAVEPIKAVDTLGAGDVFHGAFVAGWDLTTEGFAAGLEYAARIATVSCRAFGTRAWIRLLSQ